jgi:O-acetyl-ADP-ribose deacetylase (regulator of RNase III)
VARFLESVATIEQVVFVCFGRTTYEVYLTTLKERSA